MDEQAREALRRYIGARIRHARQVDGVRSAEDLATQLTHQSGRAWTRSMVANLENGPKEIVLADLCEIAAVQGRTLGWYWQEAPPGVSRYIPE